MRHASTRYCIFHTTRFSYLGVAPSNLVSSSTDRCLSRCLSRSQTRYSRMPCPSACFSIWWPALPTMKLHKGLGLRCAPGKNPTRTSWAFGNEKQRSVYRSSRGQDVPYIQWTLYRIARSKISKLFGSHRTSDTFGLEIEDGGTWKDKTAEKNEGGESERKSSVQEGSHYIM